MTSGPEPGDPGAWLDALADAAPNAVAAYRGIEAGRFISVRREVRRRAGPGSAAASIAELEALAAALAAVVTRLPEAVLRAPGGEEDWNVAQTIGHDASARSGLVLAASLAASGRWPADAPTVVPGVPGPADAPRDELLRRIGQSRRVIARAGRVVEGHETDPCPLEHPLVGRLRCGEWLLFAGVHDLMHLEQLQRIEASWLAR
ncbi:MAG TPA: DinB family protein [Candidatus Deferrimicrobiaceae bacterium]|nr:DinB family protein [Candidatus Deferrimicrobiaceae bacterium]